MKKIILSALAITMVALSFTSCSVEKRHYMKGYHIEWFGNKNEAKDITSVNATKTVVADEAVVADEQLAKAPELAPATEVAPVQKSVVAPLNVVKHAAKKNAATAVKNAANTVKENASSANAVVKQANNKNTASAPAGDDNMVLLVILAILLPPLAVYLYEGSWTKRCTVNLILTLLCGLPGVIHALVVILGGK